MFCVLLELDLPLQDRVPRDQSKLTLTGIALAEDVLDLMPCPLHFIFKAVSNWDSLSLLKDKISLLGKL